MGEKQEAYVFCGKRIVVYYDPDEKNITPRKIRFMYDDWFSSENIAKRRWFWILFGVVLGSTLTYFIR